MILLKSYTHDYQAHLDLALLEARGLRAVLHHGTVHQMLPVDVLPLTLWVHTDDKDTAEILLMPSSLVEEEEDYRHVGHREIAYLERAGKRHYFHPLWILAILLLAILLIFTVW